MFTGAKPLFSVDQVIHVDLVDPPTQPEWLGRWMGVELMISGQHVCSQVFLQVRIVQEQS